MTTPGADPLPVDVKEASDTAPPAAGKFAFPVATLLAVSVWIGAATMIVWLADSWPVRVLIVLGAVAVTLALDEWKLRARLSALVVSAQSLLEEEPVYPERSRATERIKQLLALQAPLKQQLEREQHLLRAEARRHRLAQEELRETGERYTLAVGGASDGMWEWNIGSDTTYFSPRWKSMLGYAEQEIGDSIDEWRSRIHPEDRPRVDAALHAHLEGASPRDRKSTRLNSSHSSISYAVF